MFCTDTKKPARGGLVKIFKDRDDLKLYNCPMSVFPLTLLYRKILVDFEINLPLVVLCRVTRLTQPKGIFDLSLRKTHNPSWGFITSPDRPAMF